VEGLSGVDGSAAYFEIPQLLRCPGSQQHLIESSLSNGGSRQRCGMGTKLVERSLTVGPIHLPQDPLDPLLS
jgi:hypothetical protein